MNFHRRIFSGGLILVSLVSIFAPLSARAVSVTPIRIELAADPGITLSSEFKIYNDTGQTQVFYTSAQNFETKDETGNPVFTTTDDGLASWVSIKSSVMAKPSEEVIIPFTITVPKDAEPGGYFAGLFASGVAPTEKDQTNIALGRRVGTLLLFRVNGDIPEGVSIIDFATKNHERWFTGLPISFFYRFQNSGADRIKPLGDVLIKNIFGRTSKILNANPVDGNVLPKSIRRFETIWPRAGNGSSPGFFRAVHAEAKNFALGPYKAELNLAYGNVTAKSAKASYWFFVFPWQLLLVAVIILLVLLIVVRAYLRSFKRRVLNQARRDLEQARSKSKLKQ